MKKTKNLKKVLGMSILSLVLCVSMLLGTTLAWFSDSVSSTNNNIATGTLDVKLYYQVEGSNEWVEVNEKTNIFMENALWEPGHTEVVKLKVVNAGTLALKYQLGVNVAAEQGSVNQAGEEFYLSDYILFSILDGANTYADRDAAMAAASLNGATAIKNGAAEPGALLPEAESFVTMVVYMPTEVGNEANASSDAPDPTVTLGLNLYATQLVNEEDSFDKYYDGATPWFGGVDTSWYNDADTEFVIGTPEELAGLAAITNGYADVADDFAGKTIKLASNLDLNNVNWTPIADPTSESDAYAGFAGTFDGQGYTIYNLNVNRPDAWGQGLFGYNENAAVLITNVNVHNATVIANGYAGVGVMAGYFTAGTFSDINVTGKVTVLNTSTNGYVGGIVGRGYNVNFENCAVIGDEGSTIATAGSFAGGITGYQCNNTKYIVNCQVKNVTITAKGAVGGIAGLIQTGATAVSGCVVENVVLNKTNVEGNPSIGALVGNYAGTAATVLANNTVKNVTLNGTHVAYSAFNVLYGSCYSGETTPNFDVSTTTVEGLINNLVEIAKVSDGLYTDTDGTYLIYNATALKSLSGAKIKGNYKLVADIDMGGAEFCAISAWYASANFDGNGHTVSNVKLLSGENDNGTEQASFFFVSTDGSLTVSNLTLKNITVTTKNIDNGYAAAVIGYCEGAAVLNNVDVVNANVTGSKSSGMLVGHLTPAGSLVATDCDVSGTVTISDFEADGHYAGEYVGTVAGNTTLTNCTANVVLTGNLKSTNVGTIYGRKVSGVLTIQ